MTSFMEFKVDELNEVKALRGEGKEGKCHSSGLLTALCYQSNTFRLSSASVSHHTFLIRLSQMGVHMVREEQHLS